MNLKSIKKCSNEIECRALTYVWIFALSSPSKKCPKKVFKKSIKNVKKVFKKYKKCPKEIECRELTYIWIFALSSFPVLRT